jgi:hypothetical protein
VRNPKEQERFLEHGRFGEDARTLVLPRSRWLRAGLALIGLGIVAFAFVILHGSVGPCADTAGMLAFFSAIICVFAGVLCGLVALALKLARNLRTG